MGTLTMTTGENDHEVKINYSVFGKHIPETRLQPEEWPEIEIKSLELYIRGKWKIVPYEKIPDWLENEAKLYCEENHN